jgi:hypothetical protein
VKCSGFSRAQAAVVLDPVVAIPHNQQIAAMGGFFSFKISRAFAVIVRCGGHAHTFDNAWREGNSRPELIV